MLKALDGVLQLLGDSRAAPSSLRNSLPRLIEREILSWRRSENSTFKGGKNGICEDYTLFGH